MAINESYFDVIDSQEKAYFIGYIAADGCIHKDGYKLSFCINTDDIEILNTFKQLTSCTNVISSKGVFDDRTNKTYRSTSLQVCSSVFVKSLAKYGLNYNKTKSFKVQNIPNKFIPALIRGMIDGDGYVGRKQVSLITTIEVIDFLRSYLYSNGICIDKHIEVIKKENNVFKMQIQKDRIPFLDLIYKESKIHLARKYDSYLSAKENWMLEVMQSHLTRSIKLFDSNWNFIEQFNSIKDCEDFIGVPRAKISALFSPSGNKFNTYINYHFELGGYTKIKILRNGQINKQEYAGKGNRVEVQRR